MALGQRMEGKWDGAPESLIENIREFEVTLLSDPRLHAQGCADEVGRPIHGQVKHTGGAVAL